MINSDTRIDEALLLRYFEGEVTLSEKDEIEKMDYLFRSK